MNKESFLPVKYTNSARYRCLENLHKHSLELFLKYCGIEECDSGHIYGPTQRDEFLIHIILSGKGSYTVGNKTFSLEKKNAFLIWPGKTTMYKADNNTPWRYIWIGLDGTKAREYLQFAGFHKENLVQTFECIDELKECILKILEASQLTVANSLLRESQLMHFLALLIQEKQSAQKKQPNYPIRIYVEHALEFIENHFSEPILVQDIARYIGIDRSYLTYCFKKHLNMSPQNYLIQYRLEIASGLLKTDDVTVASIGRVVGYNDPFSFSKAFKKHFGISPKHFREYEEKIKLSSNKYG